MEPFQLASGWQRPDPSEPRWNGRYIVYDGYGLEGEPGPVPVEVTCRDCAALLQFDVRSLLDGSVAANSPAWMHDVVQEFGLDIPPRVPCGPVELDVGLVVATCGACGSSHVGAFGYTEFQPARYLASFEGYALTGPVSEGRRPLLAIAVAISAVILVIGGLVWAHWSAVAGWRLAMELETVGVPVDAEVISADESHGPRTVDSYRLTVRFQPETGPPIVDVIDVDAATYTVATIANHTTVVYDPQRPERYDIEGNDQHGLDLFILGIVDLGLIAAGGVVVRQARREQQA